MFNLIMDKIVDSIKTIRGYKVNNRQIRIVCYADDAVFVAVSEDNLQILLHKFVITSTKYTLISLTLKTKLMVISKDHIRCKLEIGAGHKLSIFTDRRL